MTPAGGTTELFWHLLLALTAVVVVGRLLGRLFRFIGQPPVIGEVVAGILLGPSLLGAHLTRRLHLSPSAIGRALPRRCCRSSASCSTCFWSASSSTPTVSRDGSARRSGSRRPASWCPSPSGCGSPRLVPEACAGRRALHAFRDVHGRGDVDHGVSGAGPHPGRSRDDANRSRTARAELRRGGRCHGLVPARVCRRRGASRSEGSAVLTSVAHAGASSPFMFLVVRPARRRAVTAVGARGSRIGTSIAFALVAMLCSALITEAIGVHAIFGAFLLGAVVPHDSRLARVLEQRSRTW